MLNVHIVQTPKDQDESKLKTPNNQDKSRTKTPEDNPKSGYKKIPPKRSEGST